MPFVPTQPPAKAQSRFDHEKLEVYQLQLQFVAWVSDLFAELKSVRIPQSREVIDQLDRAGISMTLNTAEGNGRRQGQARARFFDDARGSATECAACLDVLVAKSAVTEERIREGKGMLIRVVAMLCRPVDRFDESAATSAAAEARKEAR